MPLTISWFFFFSTKEQFFIHQLRKITLYNFIYCLDSTLDTSLHVWYSHWKITNLTYYARDEEKCVRRARRFVPEGSHLKMIL